MSQRATSTILDDLGLTRSQLSRHEQLTWRHRAADLDSRILVTSRRESSYTHNSRAAGATVQTWQDRGAPGQVRRVPARRCWFQLPAPFVLSTCAAGTRGRNGCPSLATRPGFCPADTAYRATWRLALAFPRPHPTPNTHRPVRGRSRPRKVNRGSGQRSPGPHRQAPDRDGSGTSGTSRTLCSA